MNALQSIKKSLLTFFVFAVFTVYFPKIAQAQVTETFEASPVGVATFTTSGKTFNLTNTFPGFTVVNINGIGYNGSNRFIQVNDGSGGESMGQTGTLTAAAGTFKLNSFFIYLTGNSGQNAGVTANGAAGSVTFVGKLGGVPKFTVVKNTTGADLGTAVPNKGFIPINFATEGGSDNTNIIIDQLEVQLSANYDYFAIDNFTFTDVVACVAPAVTGHQPNRTICSGGSTTLPITATGTGLTYQWQQNNGSGFVNITNGTTGGTGYSGATTTTLTLTNVQGSMSGYTYRCVVTGTCGTANSNSSTLNISNIIPGLSFTNAPCNGGNGTLSANPSGGVAPYTYLWSNGATTQSISAPAGAYSLTITDNIGCAKTFTADYPSQTLIITQPSALNASRIVTNVACFGNSTGAINLTATGGAGGYTYNWGGGVTSEDRTGLAAGTYAVIITDANGCTRTVSGITVTQPAAVVSGTTVVTNVSCFGGNNGAINLTPTGGVGPYTFNWVGGATTEDRTGLTVGTYSVTITDANGCTGTVSGISVTQPTATVSGTTIVTNVSCNSATNGVIDLTPTGGTAPYTYSWGGGVTSQDRISLAAGAYSVTITDNNGCTGTVSGITVTQPTAVNGMATVTNTTCNGGTNGSIDLTPTGGTPGYTYNWGGGVTSQDRINLASGTYTVTITDANGCTAIKSFTVTQPNAISGTTVVTNVACFGNSTGAINLTPTGGTGPYTFNWGGGITTEDRTLLTAGTYSVTITDANGCTGTVGGITVTQPGAVVSGTTVVTNVACFGNNTGAINLTPTGGIGPYTFNWVGGATTEDRVLLAAGSYSVTITDANGCTGTVSGITVTQPGAVVSGTTVVTNVSCNGGSNGAINLTPTGGVGPYTFNWASGPTTEDRTGLIAGTYSVTITDANGCTGTVGGITITAPSIITMIPVSQTNVACSGGSSGAASVQAATGGTGAFTYDWAPGTPTGDGTTSVTGLTAGVWTVTATDANGCVRTQTFNITAPPAIAMTPSSQTNVSCFGGSNGTASVNAATGGAGSFTYNWTPGNPTGDGTRAVTGLPAGTWTVTATDANGCTSTQSFTITQPTAPVSGTTVVANVACNGSSSGAINLTPTGGTGPYTFNWGGGITTEDRIMLAAGTYSVTITDANGCTGVVSGITVTQPTAISGTTVVTNIACNGGTTGAINLTPTGGVGPYTFAWAGGPATEDRTGLVAGTYSVTITDANGCTGTVSGISVTQPPVLAVTPASQNNISCFSGSNGAASINLPTGGAGGYTYNWSPGNPTGDGTRSISGVPAGTWTVTVTDANSCTTTQSFTLTQPSAAVSGTTVVTNVSCNSGSNGAINLTPTGGVGPYTFNWTGGPNTEDRTGLTAGTYSVTITDANGCTGTVSGITVTQPSAPVSGTTVVTNIACNGGTTGSINLTPTGGTGPYTFSWGGGITTEDRTGLVAGTYLVVITDVNGCTGTVSGISVTQPAVLAVTPSSQNNISCFGGSNGAASINLPTGGAGGYTYNWSPGNPAGDGTRSISGVPAGTWTVTVTDVNGCTTTQSFTITAPALLVATAGTTTDVACFGGSTGSATVNVTGGTGTKTYLWAPNGNTNATATGLSAGTHTVTVTDANGCTATQSFNIAQPAAIALASQTLVQGNVAVGYNRTFTATGGSGTYSYAITSGALPSGLTLGNSGVLSGTPVTAGTFNFTVTAAESGCGQSIATAFSITINTGSQSITFNALANKVFGDAPSTLTASSTAGLALTYTSSNTAVATINGDVLTITGAGTTNITAAQTGTADYNVAIPVVQGLTVDKASATITLSGLSQTYDGTTKVATATTTPVGLSGLGITYDGSATAPSAAGTYAVIASLSNSNYTAGDATGNLVIGKQDQTITFNNLTNKIFGDAPFALTASGGASGNNITYTSSDPAVATVAGSTVTIVGAGTTTITASQAGNSNYNAATDVARTLVVGKATATITLSGLSQGYDGTAKVAVASTTPSGLSGVSITYDGSPAAPSAAGTYAVVASLTNANYAAANATGSLVIGKQDQAITFDTLTDKIFGDAPFALTATGGGSANAIIFASSNAAVATVSGTTVTIVGAGTTTITASQAGNANYSTATDVPRTLVVNKATATITLSGLFQGYDGTAKAATAVTLPAGLSGISISYDGSPAAPSAAGTYAVVASLTNANYAAANTTGNLVIGKQDQTINFNTLTDKTFGDVPFALTATGGGSANAITFTSSDNSVATIAGNTVTIVGAGTTTITASQAANANYNAAADVARNFVVGKATATITLGGLSRGYDGTAKAAVVGTAPSGLSGVSITYDGSPAAPSAAGTYAVVASLTNANYTAANATGNLVIGKQDQIITFAALVNRTFGDAPFALTATGGGSANTITFTSSNIAVATVSGNTVTIVGAGTTTITASQAGNANHNPATDLARTLVVGKATSTITLGGLSQGYDGTVKAVTATTAPAGLSGVSITYDGSVTAPSAAGSYGVVASLTNSDYAAANATGNLVIGRQDQTINFNTLVDKIFGDAPFALTASGGGSANAITFTSLNTAVATISGNTVTIVGAGTTTINASQAGNANYNAAIDVPRVLNVAGQGQTIIFAALSNKTYGDAPVILNATGGGSGNVVTFASSNTAVATVAGNTLTIVGAGSANITASQAGNANYGAAIAVTQPLTIAQKPIAGTFVAANKNYDGNTTATITSRSLTGVLTADLANVGLSGGTATFTSAAVGTNKAITGTGMNLTGSRAGNYSLTGVTNPAADILPKVLTLTADAKVKTYGDSDPALTYVVATGGLIGSDAVTGNLVRSPGNTAGNYPINIGTLTAGNNYNINYAGANLVINRKALTITADNKDKFVGTANPALTASYSGFVTGETATVLTSQPMLSTTATAASPIGNYPISATGAVGANYTISYVPGVLTVRPGTPSSVALAGTALLENQPAGTLAGTVSSVSADPSATFTYSLVAGTGSADNASFVIVGNQLRTAAVLDYETKNSFSILVRSTTQYGQFLDQVFAITLGDVNEVPTLAAIADQTICYTTATQNVALSGISSGPETAQTTTISVSGNNAALFQNLSVSRNGTLGTLSYSARAGASGTAIVTVTVRDNGGTANGGVDVVVRTFNITINALPDLVVVSDKGASVSKGETIRLTASGGSSYVWSNAAGIISGQNTAVLTVRPSVNTTYTVTATSAAGCSQSASFTLEVASDFLKLNISNLLTPNGDGFNDKWIIENIDLYPNNSVRVFDKAGRTMYEKKGYDNSWEGTLRGAPLAEDTYYYVIDFGPGFGALKGFITILSSK